MVQTPAQAIALEEFLKLPETEPASEYIDGQMMLLAKYFVTFHRIIIALTLAENSKHLDPTPCIILMLETRNLISK